MNKQPKLSEIFESTREEIYLGPMQVDEIDSHLTHSQVFLLPPTPEFVANVAEMGVLQPIEIELLDGTIKNEPVYYIRAGKRRFQAARLAHLETINVLVTKNTGLSGPAVTLSENLHRSNNIITELDAINEIVRTSEETLSDKDLAQILGIPLQTIEKRRKVALLPSPILQAVKAQKMAITTAEHVAKKAEKRPTLIGDVVAMCQAKDEETWEPVKVTRAMVDDLFKVEETQALLDFEMGMMAQATQAPDPPAALIEKVVNQFMPKLTEKRAAQAAALVAHVLEKGLLQDD